MRNLAPYSFFSAFNYTPPIAGFASIGWKDSVANIKETGEFVWNLVTRALAERMNTTSATIQGDEVALQVSRRRRAAASRPIVFCKAS